MGLRWSVLAVYILAAAVLQQSGVSALVSPTVGQVPPSLYKYTLSNSADTFEVCHNVTGIPNDLPMEDLLPAFRLPADLPKHSHISLPRFMRLLQRAQPDAQLVLSPMLQGAADLVGTPTMGLPNLIHFTVKDKNRLKPHQALSIISWAVHNPGHAIILYDDEDVRQFMIAHHPALLPTFDSLASQVERTDMWRYLVLCTFGGVYADSDVVSGKPVDAWVQDAGLLVGIENVFRTLEEAKRRTYTRQVQMVQWVIAAQAGHPVVCRMGDYIKRHIEREASGAFSDPDRDHAILERTGPGIWSSSVHDYLEEHGVNITDLVAGGKVGDVRVFPQPSFGCPASVFQEGKLAVPYTYHMFKGSWRVQPLTGGSTFLERLRNVVNAVSGFARGEVQAAKQAYAAAADRWMDPSAFGVRGTHSPRKFGSSSSSSSDVHWLGGSATNPGPNMQVQLIASLLLLVSFGLVLVLTAVLKSWPWCKFNTNMGSFFSMRSHSSPATFVWLRRAYRKVPQLLLVNWRGLGSSSGGSSSSMRDLTLPFVVVAIDRTFSGPSDEPQAGSMGAFTSSQHFGETVGRLKRTWGSTANLVDSPFQ
jgi:hypothetical protein